MVDVIVVGAGPTGLLLAGELALAGVDVRLVERRATTELVGMRARGFHSRTIELLDQRGIAERFLDAGETFAAASFANVPVDLSTVPTRHPYTLALVQSEVERILTDWVAELDVPVLRGHDVVGCAQDETGVDLHLGDGTSLRAAYLVGADGGRSTIRKAAGIGFPGWDATRTTLIAEVDLTEEPPPGIRVDETGVHGLTLLPNGRTQVLVTEQQLGPSTRPTLADLSGALVAVFGTDFGAHSPTTISRFSDATRQADAYRAGRVLLAGDAAHVHGPTGGQGIGLGAEDATNLGWKLAQVVRGTSPESLLDTYQAERHAATARVLQYTMAMALAQRTDPRVGAMTGLLGDLLSLEAARARLACLHLGLDVTYGPEDGGHPLVGRRIPDLELNAADGPVRMTTLLHAARPVLVALDAPIGPAIIGGWTDRVRVVEAAYDGAWVLPVVGTVEAPAVVLIRPDGHVAWVGDGTGAGLAAALTRWFGP